MINKDITIGLFGTCGKSTWRNEFIIKYEHCNIKYFNPQVPEGTWHPGCVDDENFHLMNDDIILFPVTSETTGQGSLAEIGFSISASLRRNPDRFFIFMIDDACKDPDASPVQIKESYRTRTLVKSKIKLEAKENSGIYLVDTIDDMMYLSVDLYNIMVQFKNSKKQYNIG